MLTRTNTKQLKAVAILLMLAHHLFTFPDRIPYGLSPATSIMISNLEFTQCIGTFGKICVSILCFLADMDCMLLLSPTTTGFRFQKIP